MSTSNQHFLKIGTLIGVLCLSIPLSIYGLWIYVFDKGTNQAQRVAIYNEYFPDLFHGRWTITLVGMAFCFAAIILSRISMKLSGIWKVFNVLIFATSTLLLLLNLFSMM